MENEPSWSPSAWQCLVCHNRSRDIAVAVVKGARHRLGPKDLNFVTHSNSVWNRTTHPSATDGDFSGDSHHCKTKGRPLTHQIFILWL